MPYSRIGAAQTGAAIAVIFDDLSEVVSYSPSNGNLVTVAAYCGSQTAVMSVDDNGATVWGAVDVSLGSSSGKIWLFSAIVSGSPSSFTVSIDDNGAGGQFGWAKVIEWAGNASVSVLDDTATNSVTGTSHPTGTVDGTVSEYLAIAMHLIGGGGDNTPDAAWNTEHDNTTDGIVVSYKIGSVPAVALQATATSPVSEDSANLVGLYKGALGGSVITQQIEMLRAFQFSTSRGRM